MKTNILQFNNDLAFKKAIETLQAGGLIAFPTDTVYGLACDLWNEKAIEKIYAAKARSKEKPLPILIGKFDQLQTVVELSQINNSTTVLIRHFWPGALTVILPKVRNLPKNLSPFPTVGIRMPNHPRLLELLAQTGPLAVTSANQSGKDNPTTAQAVFEQLQGRIELILDGGETNSDIPSTVIASDSDGYRVLREGAITQGELQSLFQ